MRELIDKAKAMQEEARRCWQPGDSYVKKRGPKVDPNLEALKPGGLEYFLQSLQRLMGQGLGSGGESLQKAAQWMLRRRQWMLRRSLEKAKGCGR